MKPVEDHIDIEKSDFFVRSPSTEAMRSFLYLLRAGRFVYEPGYEVSRSSFNSFLIMYIVKGEMTLTLDDHTVTAHQGSFCLVDCYRPHSYSTSTGATVLWVHFDGIGARQYYQYISDRADNAFELPSPETAARQMRWIFDTLKGTGSFAEPRMACALVTILTEFALRRRQDKEETKELQMQDTVSYISSHLGEDLSVPKLASRLFMSEYHFIRTFKQSVGMTPHAYIISVRIHAAQYLLANGTASMTQICQLCGFSSVTAFGAAFRRSAGMAPTEYRRRNMGSPRPLAVLRRDLRQ